MDEQNFPQANASIQGPKNTWIILASIIVTALIIGGVVYMWQRSNLKSTEQNLQQQISLLQNQISSLQQQILVQDDKKLSETKQNQNNTNTNNQDATTSNWQTYSDSKFSYECPQEWLLGKNKNYNGQVDLSACSKIYSGKISFDDGVNLTFGFVPKTVADNYEWAGQKWSETLLNEVKNEANAQSYSNNNFIGWISMQNQKHTLSLIARYQVSDGYYEVSASAMGDTKTDKEFKQMIDDIILTFKVK